MQPTLTSALQGWGVGSLDQDAKDVLQLTNFLKAEHSSQVPSGAKVCLIPNQHREGAIKTHFAISSRDALQAVILIGHSTGCQDAVRYAEMVQEKGSDAAPLAGIVLQAPVRIMTRSCKTRATLL